MRVKDLFDVKYGVNLELVNCEIVPQNAPDSVNFVARTGENNGVVARVKRIADIAPQPAGTLSCAGGGSVLSTFIQTEPYYSGRDLYVLTSKKEMSLNEKLFWCTCISHNSFRFSYGRQANKSIPNIEIPDIVPEWVDAVCSAPIYTKNGCCGSPLNIDTHIWKEFLVSDMFDISVSVDENLQNSNVGTTPYVASSSENNGVTAYIDANPSQRKNSITIARNGSVGATFYQSKDYCASPDDIRILTPRFEMNVYSALFIKTVIEKEKFRYGYGRKLGTARIKNIVIKLPVTDDGAPDFDYMERYIKSLPYSDRIPAE